MLKISKILLLIALLVFMFPVILMAADTVYLKDGSVIKGEIISITETTVVIKTNMGIIEIDKNTIEKIEFDAKTSKPEKEDNNEDESREQVIEDLQDILEEDENTIIIIIDKSDEKDDEEEVEEIIYDEEEDVVEVIDEEEEIIEVIDENENEEENMDMDENEDEDFNWEEDNNYNWEDDDEEYDYGNHYNWFTYFFNGAGGGPEYLMLGLPEMNFLSGGRGYVDILTFLRIGGFGYSNSYIFDNYYYEPNNLYYGFGGVTFGVFHNIGSVNFAAELDIGFGSDVFVLIPRTSIAIKLYPWMRLGIYVGYVVDLLNFQEDYYGLQNMTFGLNVIFGWFPV
jgi:hypothetical protein